MMKSNKYFILSTLLALILSLNACTGKKAVQVMVLLNKAEQADGGKFRYNFTIENDDKTAIAGADLAISILKTDGSKATTVIEHTEAEIAPGGKVVVSMLMDIDPKAYGGATYTLSNNDIEVSGVVSGTP